LPFRVFASPARFRVSPPESVLSWNWSLVQSTAPAPYRPRWFCEPTTPLAPAPVLWVSAADTAGGRFRSPGSSLSSSFTFLQSLDQPTLAAPTRGATPLLSFRTLQHLRITESTTTGLACPPVPPSGFGYPLDGFLLGDPRRPCFRSAALLGFALRSILLPTGASASLPR
jgi:hypothetical protein